MTETQQQGTDLAVFSPARLPFHPVIEERFGVDKGQWKVLTDAIFPAAKTAEAVVLALAYCQHRKLDPFKKPVHIVPMYDSAKGEMVETVWPGISEIRTTAARTGEYAGCDAAEFGPEITVAFKGRIQKWVNRKQEWIDDEKTVTFPAWCRITVYRVVKGVTCKFVGPKVVWKESYATIGKTDLPNDMWESRPEGQIEKCAEAAALRRAFPEEIGNELTAEEMQGRVLQDLKTEIEVVAAPARDDAPPRRAEIAKAETPATEPAKSDPPKSDPPKADPPKAETKPETKPEPEQVEEGVFEEEKTVEENGGFDDTPKVEEPYFLETKGETFASLADKYILKIQQSTEASQVMGWVDRNQKTLDRLASDAPATWNKVKLAQEQQLRKVRSTPKSAPEPAKDKPPKATKKAATKPPKGGEDEPESILRKIDAALSRVEDPDHLETVWNDQCVALLDDLMPPDKDEAQALLKHHTKRLEK